MAQIKKTNKPTLLTNKSNKQNLCKPTSTIPKTKQQTTNPQVSNAAATKHNK